VARQLRQSTLRSPFVTGAVPNQRQNASLDHAPLAATTDIRYHLPVQYEWDDDKAAENLRKHGVDFADAIGALEDQNRVEEIDDRFVYDEERVQVVGMAHGKVLFVVVTLPGEDTCRIISARKATRHEQDRYYAGDRETW
jgi:uncharacterized DUF497 family protein